MLHNSMNHAHTFRLSKALRPWETVSNILYPLGVLIIANSSKNIVRNK